MGANSKMESDKTESIVVQAMAYLKLYSSIYFYDYENRKYFKEEYPTSEQSIEI
jgi:hypothetical protein